MIFGGEHAQAWTKLSDKEMEGLAFHDGFFRQYTAIHSELRVVLKNAATALGTDYKLIVTGHSMGGALACICCFDLLASGFAKACTYATTMIPCLLQGQVSYTAALRAASCGGMMVCMCKEAR